jgi:threonine synthase
VLWKLDALMPTGSYKDRGVSVMVNWLAGFDVEVVVDDSSGNAGASLACYAARAGMDACIYVPSSAPEPKRAQVSVYGADLVEVPGPRENAALAARAATLTNHETAYASHAWHPAFLLGQMTCAWEIWEQLDGRAPDWLIAPTGHGGTLLGAWRGFQHLQRAGLVDRLPRLVSVQAKPYTPFYEAFVNGWDRVQPRSVRADISADGIAINQPVRDATLLAAIYLSHGIVLALEEEQIRDAHERLAGHGIFVEPTSATVAAALDELRDEIAPDETVVAILTGHGLKNPPSVI